LSVDQLTLVVMSIDEPSEIGPLGLESEARGERDAGVRRRDSMRVSIAAVTLTWAVPLVAPKVAVIVCRPLPQAGDDAVRTARLGHENARGALPMSRFTSW